MEQDQDLCQIILSIQLQEINLMAFKIFIYLFIHLDYPALVFLALAGNDVCNPHPGKYPNVKNKM